MGWVPHFLWSLVDHSQHYGTGGGVGVCGAAKTNSNPPVFLDKTTTITKKKKILGVITATPF